jgi:DNA-binding FadR family transcriptional regulator
MAQARREASPGPAARPSRAEAVKRELTYRIVSQQLRPGDRLPSERTLAVELGVSRNVLREAVGSLAAMNVLQTQPGAGIFVAELDTASLLEPIVLAMSLGPSNLHSVIQARLVIEPGIAALAAQLGGAGDIDDLYRLVQRSREVIEDAVGFLDVDVEIHDAIVRMARNPILARISDSISRLARASRELTNADPALRRVADQGHEAIFRAIAARDIAGAEASMRDHLTAVDSHLFDYERKLAPAPRVSNPVA